MEALEIVIPDAAKICLLVVVDGIVSNKETEFTGNVAFLNAHLPYGVGSTSRFQ